MEDTELSCNILLVCDFGTGQFESFLAKPHFHINRVEFDQVGLVPFRKEEYWADEATPEARQEAEEAFLQLLCCETVSIGTLDFTNYMSFTDPYDDHELSYDYMKACAIAASRNKAIEKLIVALYPNSSFSVDFAEMLLLTGSKPVQLKIRGQHSEFDNYADNSLCEARHLTRIAQCIRKSKNIVHVSFCGCLHKKDDRFLAAICAALAERQSATIQQFSFGCPASEFSHDPPTFDVGIIRVLLSSGGCSAAEKLKLECSDLDSHQIKTIFDGAKQGTINSLVVKSTHHISTTAQNNLVDCITQMACLTELKFEGTMPSVGFFLDLFESNPTILELDLSVTRNEVQHIEKVLECAKLLQVLRLRVVDIDTRFEDISTGLFKGLQSSHSLRSLEFPDWREVDGEPSFNYHLRIDPGKFMHFFLENNRTKLQELTIGSWNLVAGGLYNLLNQPKSSLKKLSVLLTRDFNDQNIQLLVAALHSTESLHSLVIMNESNSMSQSMILATALAGLKVVSFKYQDVLDEHRFPKQFKEAFLQELKYNQSVENASLLGYYRQPWWPGLQEEIDSICLGHVLHNKINCFYDAPQSMRTLPIMLESIEKKCPNSQLHLLDKSLSIYMMEHLLRIEPQKMIEDMENTLKGTSALKEYEKELEMAFNILAALRVSLSVSNTACLEATGPSALGEATVRDVKKKTFKEDVIGVLNNVLDIKQVLTSTR